MKTEDKIRIQANRLLGEFLGTLEGILAWDIPKELRERLKERIEELRKTEIEPAEKKKLDLDKMSKKFDELIQNITPEEIAEYFPEDNIPKGWISIEDHLPQMYAKDIEQGYSVYKVKDAEDAESTTQVTDHTMWYYMAKDAGITHWFNE